MGFHDRDYLNSARTVTTPHAGTVMGPVSLVIGFSPVLLSHTLAGAGSRQVIVVLTSRPAAPQRRTMIALPSSLGLQRGHQHVGRVELRSGVAGGAGPRAGAGRQRLARPRWRSARPRPGRSRGAAAGRSGKREALPGRRGSWCPSGCSSPRSRASASARPSCARRPDSVCELSSVAVMPPTWTSGASSVTQVTPQSLVGHVGPAADGEPVLAGAGHLVGLRPDHAERARRAHLAVRAR